MTGWACVVCASDDPWLCENSAGQLFCVPCASLLLQQQGRSLGSALKLPGENRAARRRRIR